MSPNLLCTQLHAMFRRLSFPAPYHLAYFPQLSSLETLNRLRVFMSRSLCSCPHTQHPQLNKVISHGTIILEGDVVWLAP